MLNLMIIWLILSAISTLLVLWSIRFAPPMEDEPLDIRDDPSTRLDERHPANTQAGDSRHSASSHTVREHEQPASHPGFPPRQSDHQIASIHSVKKGTTQLPNPRLANYSILRWEEHQS